jgi:hypothetical protein
MAERKSYAIELRRDEIRIICDLLWKEGERMQHSARQHERSDASEVRELAKRIKVHSMLQMEEMK